MPTQVHLRAASSDGVSPFEIFGRGGIRDGGQTQMDFLFRGPTGKFSAFGERDEYRAALPTIAKLQPDLAPTVNIPVWSERVDTDSLRFLGDRMTSYGLLRNAPDIDAAVYSSP